MARGKITNGTAGALQPPQKQRGEAWLWDTELPGFGLKALPSGRRVFVCWYRPKDQRRGRKVTLGAFGPMTVTEAREAARRLLSEVGTGRDPARERAARREAKTVKQLVEDFLAAKAGIRKPKTLATYRAQFERLVYPAIGNEQVATVDRQRVSKLHLSLKETPYLANRVLAQLSAFFSWAIRHGFRPDGTNPCKHIERFPEEHRERYLSPDEVQRLGAALTEAEADGAYQPAVDAIRLLALTGARREEILQLKWSEVRFDTSELALDDSKTGRSRRPLSAPALQLLTDLSTRPREPGNPYVFPGVVPGQPLVDVKRLWSKVRTAAGLEGVRLHDLRHTFASLAIATGASLPMIGALLGHQNQTSTQRYAHLANDVLRDVATRALEGVGASLIGQPAAAPADTIVVPITRPRRSRKTQG